MKKLPFERDRIVDLPLGGLDSVFSYQLSSDRLFTCQDPELEPGLTVGRRVIHVEWLTKQS